MWPLHTTEALAPLIVALAHIQVALAPISIYRICGPCTWPLHLFLGPLHRPLPRENAPFQPSKRYTTAQWDQSLWLDLSVKKILSILSDFLWSE
jgi:hypothetical protein